MEPFGLEALRRLHELVVGIHSIDGLNETLDAVLDGVRDLLGFEVACINLVQPDGWHECVAVSGNEEARAAALGMRRPPADVDAEQDLGERWGDLIFVDHSLVPDGDIGWVSDEEPGEGPDAWHPLDLLYALLLSRSGEVLGTLCVDMPLDRRRPGPVQRQLLQMFASHAAIAIESSRSLEMVRSSEVTMRLAFEGAGNPMALVSLDPASRGRYLRANPALCRLLGRSEEQLQQMSVRDVMHPDELDRHTVDVDRLVRGELDHYTRERRYLTADGQVVWVELVVTMVDEVRGQQPYAMALMQDITARRRTEAELERRAMHDALTDLPNRRALESRLERSLALTSPSTPGVVFFCDLDGFKAVNDTHGHAAGDQVLLAVTDRLSRLVRGDDAVYRIGGDEFVIVADAMPPERAAVLAAQIDEVVRAPIRLSGVTVSVRCSVGTAVLASGTSDAESVLREADRAMYEVKTAHHGGPRALAAAST